MHFDARLSRIAQGLERAELVLKNGRVLDTNTGEIYPGDVAVEGGLVVGVGEYAGREEIDLGGRLLCPGFVDAHLHLESCLANPAELVLEAARHGTLAFVVDPHEVANVAGGAGIAYLMECLKGVPADVYVQMPSCVPALPGENNGGAFRAADMAPFLGDPRVLGLGEVMDLPAVLEAREDMLDKLRLFENRPIDGHGGFLRGGALNAYALAGISSDHECVDFEAALQEARAGLRILVRQGSAARNLQSIVSGLVASGVDSSAFCFCTDDKHIRDIRREGHIDHNVRASLALGLPLVQAVQMASRNAAQHYGLRHLGAITPGKAANLLVVDDRDGFVVERALYRGRPVESWPLPEKPACPEDLLHTVRLAELGPDPFAMADGPAAVIEVVPGQILTKLRRERLPGLCGRFQPDGTYSKAAVLERHRASGNIGLAAVKGFGIRGGAIAATMGHDSHNLIVLGDNDRDMRLAVEELVRCQGGYALVEDGYVAGCLPLPAMGLLSLQGASAVDQTLDALIRKAHQMGVPEGIEPFVTLAFLPLPVLPEARLTDRGLLDVTAGRYL